jgi:amidase
MPAEALARAQYLDDYLAEHGKPIGPLHGLPISIKEHLPMQGRTIDCGYIAWYGRVSEVTFSGTEALYNAGAVLYARTTQPQSLMHLATSSNLYGETVCPYNRKLTSGGSSGGEGALIALHGSVLGIGTDIGGSIRSPAANNGIYGLRPTSSRFPYDRAAAGHGPMGIACVAGPLSASRGGLRLVMKTVIDAKPWLTEPSLLPIPWREDRHFTGKIKIGVLWDDGVVKPHPPVTRALKEVVAKLRGVPGVEIVDWKPYKHEHAWERIASLYYADGAAHNFELFAAGGEPMLPLTQFIVTENEHRKRLQIEDVWELMEKNAEYRKEYAAAWNSTATGVDEGGLPTGMVDVILSPTGPGAAPPVNQARYWGYTAQWNLLDYPAAVFPVTSVQPEVDHAEEYEPRNSKDEFNYKLCQYSMPNVGVKTNRNR